MPTINISAPNDANSHTDEVAAIKDCYDGDANAAKEDCGREFYEVLATAANSAGLTFVAESDFGADWKGTEEQIAACRAALPSWAYVSEAG